MNLLERIGASAWAQGFKTVKCGSQSCSRWLTHRQLSVRSVGVMIADTWYCSYRCCRGAAKWQIDRLLAPQVSLRRRPAHPPLGLALVRHGLLTDSQYREVSKIERQSTEEIGDIIVRLGLLTELQITHARASQWSCPFFAHSHAIERSIFRIPSMLMQRYTMAPIHHTSAGNRLFVGFVYEVEYEALYAIEQIMGCTTQPCFITPQEFKRIIAARSGTALSTERTDTLSSDSSEITDALCADGASIDADRIALARCGDILWGRVRAATKTADRLFSAAASIRPSSHSV